ncbi:Gfo/Idh/MocA family oxidoreductase [Gordonia polyisoprenivorans]|uniref:Gfo/Idh/MocA family protein n=1 Tax=Gordonia polyisoprenivorans TaxID=84595 RepID=UPI0019F84B8F|nr:Gfo/Idh/MocA family oxidoreductase [Gordonia polyisoprenivorans]MBE7191120.1 Gfo/Idh/MocA family oxidoreductase [Gordonia polyisoprenivorans]QUD83588.1 Gfo/Idh/MocA family oxidoreductase [Gordonia polyisoprenivorans]UZF55450.1 Gfo/Idh/MocA family oxidoreductase [Gordonia polyisoprenivorans]
MTEIRVAIIGGGGFMGYAHSLGWALAPIAGDAGARIHKTVLVEATDERAKNAAHRLGWDEWSTDWREVITREDIDVVDIVTPPALHAEIAIAALAAGKHVFVEKPISNDLTEADEMAAAAQTSPTVNQVGFNYRHAPAITFIKRLLSDGTLGHPLQFRAHYTQDVAVLGRVLSGWRAQKGAGGSGVTGDIGSHIIDMASYLVGDIESVTSVIGAKNPAPDTAWLSDADRKDGDYLDDSALWMARFANGALGSFAATVFASGRKNRLFFELECTGGTVEFDWNHSDEVLLSLVSDPPEQQGFRRVSMNENHEDFWWPLGGMGSGYVDDAALQLQKFVRAIVEGRAGSPSFADATRTQRVIAAVMESADSHQWVVVDEVRS